MREILYRGISKETNQFVFGGHGYIKRTNKHYILVETEESVLSRIEVCPDTVGEYSGFDIQGTKSFEGDVFVDIMGEKWVVDFRRGFFGVADLKTHEFCSLNVFVEVRSNSKCIGTIHDHYFDMPYEDKKLLNEELVILNETVAQIEKVISKHVNIDKLAESLRKLNDEIKKVSKEVQI